VKGAGTSPKPACRGGNHEGKYREGANRILLFDVAVFFRQNHYALKQLQVMGGMKQWFQAMER
jgi:hypothetical protein